MTKVACIGECMIELKQAERGLYSRSFGGDTLNTAIYLSRLGIEVDYITALGDDTLSDEMIAGWATEGVGTSRVARLKGKLPGLYMIQTDEFGDRRFFHWRENSAARCLMDLPETDGILDSLASYDVIYLSAITLSIYGAEGRTKLLDALHRARKRSARIAFDTNFRARGWPEPDVARAVFGEAFAASDIVLASTEDMLPLYPDESDEQLMVRMPCNEVVLKLLQPGSLVRFEGVSQTVSAEPLIRPVVDTTAAGDSFSAAYIATRLAGAQPAEAARAGHGLGGVVVGYPGAIIPRSAMPPNMLADPPSVGKASQ
jgi:2-dehydro-3-deoxygluconokinase